MVSFQCEGCGDVATKKKLDAHYNQCHAPFSCLDCQTTFHGTEYRSHTACISEAQKYQGHLYREKDNKKNKSNKRKSVSIQEDASQAMVPLHAYVEDLPEGDDMNAIAIVDVPPPCPTPPPTLKPVAELPENVNVFDYLVHDDTTPVTEIHVPRDKQRHSKRDSQYSQLSNGDGQQYLRYGYSYGNAPVQPGMDRFDSWNHLTESQQSQILPPPSYVTPGPKDAKKKDKEKGTTDKSDKKRKRIVEDLDMSNGKRPVSRDALMSDGPMTASSARMLHSGLTGGLSRLVTDAEFYEDRIEAGPTPISPIKRSKREKDFKDARDDHRKSTFAPYPSSKASSSSRHHEEPQHHHRTRSTAHERHSERQAPKHSRRRDSSSSDELSHASRRRYKAIEYPDRPGSVQPTSSNQLVQYRSRAELFMSFVTKGPDSLHGCSINKALKRYHRERDVRGDEREEDDKELWKSLRLRRNSRGEVVLFTG